jgi:hypothetical protein
MIFATPCRTRREMYQQRTPDHGDRRWLLPQLSGNWDAKECRHCPSNSWVLTVFVNGVQGCINTVNAFGEPLVQYDRPVIATAVPAKPGLNRKDISERYLCDAAWQEGEESRNQAQKKRVFRHSVEVRGQSKLRCCRR